MGNIYQDYCVAFIDILGFKMMTSTLEKIEKNSTIITTHDVTWSRRDSFCEGQYKKFQEPEEFPTAPVRTQILQLPKRPGGLSFAKFDFDEEEPL